MAEKDEKDESLDLHSAEDLIDAIGRRYEVWAFVAARDKTQNGDIVTMQVSSGGDRLRAIGLCHYLASKLSRDIVDDIEDAERG